MKKKLSLTIGIILIALIASSIFFLNSNVFKNYLTHSLSVKTGKTIQITQPLSWKFFPILQCTATGITATDTKTTWLIDQAIIPLSWVPLRPREVILKNIKIKIKDNLVFSGQGIIDTFLTKDLKGQGHFSFNQIELQGVDIPYLISVAQHFLNHSIQPSTNHHQTSFTQLTGSFNISNGILENTNLLAYHPLFTTKGAGTIHLKQHAIQYRLIIAINKKPNEKNDVKNLYGIQLPIIIEGPLNDIKAKMDMAVLINALMNQPVLNIKGKKVKPKDLIKNLLGF